MSDRIKSLTVVLEEGINDDMAVKIADAIRLTVGVISVVSNVETFEDLVAVERVKRELRKKLWEALK